MINPKTGVDDAKYYAMTVVIAVRLEPEALREEYSAKALKWLVKAVKREARLRGTCRDLDVAAATRRRA